MLLGLIYGSYLANYSSVIQECKTVAIRIYIHIYIYRDAVPLQWSPLSYVFAVIVDSTVLVRISCQMIALRFESLYSYS